MGRRRVTHSGKDNLGRISKLCNPKEFWSPRKSEDAIKDIERVIMSIMSELIIKKSQ